jgi:rare lipoprotein A
MTASITNGCLPNEPVNLSLTSLQSCQRAGAIRRFFLLNSCDLAAANETKECAFLHSAPRPGNELQGHRTASGEMVNPSGMTVAHKSPPFGTCLVVGNPKTGKSVAVHVNDRGPFTAGLTLDLSVGAVQAIGMRATERVTMRRCCIARWSVDDRPSRCRQSKPTIGPGTRLEQRRVNFKRSEMAASSARLTFVIRNARPI